MLRQFNVIRKLGKLKPSWQQYTPLQTNIFKPILNITILGEGSFGSVYLVKRISDSQLYALKKVSNLVQSLIMESVNTFQTVTKN
jgi:hypothetical protein